jgi:hypothetical protein
MAIVILNEAPRSEASLSGGGEERLRYAQRDKPHFLPAQSITLLRIASGPSAAFHVHSFTPPGRNVVARPVSP